MKNNPFAGLRGQLGLPELQDAGASEPPAGATASPVAPAAAPPVAGPRRAVVRYERAGRGGKEATVVEQLGLAPDDLRAWLRHLKHALGCGGSVDGDVLMLQGDQRARLPALLATRGVRKITVS